MFVFALLPTSLAYTVDFTNNTDKGDNSITIDDETLKLIDADENSSTNLTVERWSLTTKKIEIDTNSSYLEFEYEAQNTNQPYEIYLNDTLVEEIKTDGNGTATFEIDTNSMMTITIPEAETDPYYIAFDSFKVILVFVMISVVFAIIGRIMFDENSKDKVY